MDTDRMFEILFPPSFHHDYDKERYAHFLERRLWLLTYVDGLIEKYGEKEVLAFH